MFLSRSSWGPLENSWPLDFHLNQLKHLWPPWHRIACTCTAPFTAPARGQTCGWEASPPTLPGQYSWLHLVTSLPCPHFSSHPIMGNVAKNPQRVKEITSVHCRYGQIMTIFVCWCTQKMKLCLLFCTSGVPMGGENDELSGPAKGSPAWKRRQRSLYLVQS